MFFGKNAQGKSNLLEAMSLLGTGKSFRTSKDADLVRRGLEVATITGLAAVRSGEVRLGCVISNAARGTRKIYTVNGQSVRYARFLGSLKVVTFVPADLQLVSGAPSARRAFMNVTLAQDRPAYYRELARYQKALQQKAALLRAPAAPDRELLAIYNATLVEAGTHVMLERAHFVQALAIAADRVHAQWTGGRESLAVRYAPNVSYEISTADAIASALARRLRDVESAEVARKAALAGPHRDDLALDLNGVPLASFGSQGQQRTAVLALKVGEYSVMRESSGEAPLLLLDDVLSELDAERATAFMAGVGDYEQAFITTAHLPASLPASRIFEIADAAVMERA